MLWGKNYHFIRRDVQACSMFGQSYPAHMKILPSLLFSLPLWCCSTCSLVLSAGSTLDWACNQGSRWIPELCTLKQSYSSKDKPQCLRWPITGQLTEHWNGHTPGSADREVISWEDRSIILIMATMLDRKKKKKRRLHLWQWELLPKPWTTSRVLLSEWKAACGFMEAIIFSCILLMVKRIPNSITGCKTTGSNLSRTGFKLTERNDFWPSCLHLRR